MKKVSILIPDPGPLGETFLDANVRAIVSGSFVNSPSGGNVETVWTFPDHFLVVAVLDMAPPGGCRGSLVFFEVLHFAFVLLSLLACCEGAQVAALACAGVLLS